MNIFFILLGMVAGGMVAQFGGLVCGGAIGFLYGRLHTLQQRQGELEAELALLRERVVVSPGEGGAGVAATPVATVPVVELTEADLLPSDYAAAREPVSPPPGRCAPREEPVCREYLRTGPVEDESESPLWLRRLCSGENLLVKLGVLILFIGVSFLVKYVAQRGLFPIELRLTTAALGGCALLAVGWRVRQERPVYAQVIQGGGVGILYLTTYAAMALYHLVSPPSGFILLAITCGLAALLALLQDARPLAVMGSIGGFLAPELASIASSSPAMLFGYYAVLNGGILAIARQRNWRELDLVGFVGTFIVSALWGSRFYRPEYFATVEPFLVIFFLTYALLPVIHARQQPTTASGYLDLSLTFATPTLAFAFQSAMVQRFEYGLAWSALAAAAFYLCLAKRLVGRQPARLASLVEAFLALGTLFATLAIPLALEGRWTSAAWSVEGAALVWAGMRRQRPLARGFGYLLLVGSGAFFLADRGLSSGVWPVMNSSYIGCLLIAGAALFTARLLARNRDDVSEQEIFVEPLLVTWGLFWWFAGGVNEVVGHTQHGLIFGALLTFVAASCLACRLLGERLDWRLLRWPGLGLLPAMVGFALVQFLGTSLYPTAQGGWFGWCAALGAWYLMLRRSEGEEPFLPSLSHGVPLWLLTLLVCWELHGRIMHHLPGMSTWALCAGGAVPALAVLLLSRYHERLPWPVAGHRCLYLGVGALPLAAVAGGWLLLSLTNGGNPWPLPYLPLVNPLDATTLLVLISLIGYYRTLEFELPQLPAYLPRREATMALATAGFLWGNAMLLRTVHHWHGIPYTFAALFASLFVQTTISILWSLLALVLMVLATRHRLRTLWLAGGGLLGVVVAKLFLVDLAGHGSVARIVSFVVVGLLLLLIGWFAPVPPRGEAGRLS
jgi:uncharacterized membrane protein